MRHYRPYILAKARVLVLAITIPITSPTSDSIQPLTKRTHPVQNFLLVIGYLAVSQPRSQSPVKVLSRTFKKTRVLVAFALFLSAGAPLVQYACGVAGETMTTSTLVAEAADTDTAPCGVLSDGAHERLCGEHQSSPVCEGGVCTSDTVEKQSVLHSETSKLRLVSALSTGDLFSGEDASSGALTSSPSASGSDWSARECNQISVRFRTLSFRL